MKNRRGVGGGQYHDGPGSGTQGPEKVLVDPASPLAHGRDALPKAIGKSPSGQERRQQLGCVEPAPWQPHRQTRSEIPHEPPGSGCAGRTNVRGPDPFATAGTVQHPAGAPPLPPHVRSRIRISHRFFPLRNIDAPLEYPRRPVTVRSRRTAEPFEDRKGQPIANGHRGGAMPMGADGTLPGPEHAAVGTPIAT